jgi:Kyanoviridae SbcC-like subunit of palindrome specific endonuclease
MIRFGKLRWRNLLSTGNSFTEVNLGEKGTTLVVGANGTGKSTLLEALSFALYGKSFRKVHKGQLVNSINKKDMVVECEFTVGDSAYLVRRGMKPSVFEVIVDGVPMNSHGSMSDDQDFLEKYVLRMNYRACMQVVVLGSASYVPFMDLPAQHRREVLEDLLDIRILGVMASNLKSRSDTTERMMMEAERGVTVASESYRAARAIADAREGDRAAAVQAVDARIAEVKSKIKEVRDKAVDRSARIDEVTPLSADPWHEYASVKARLSAIVTGAKQEADKLSLFKNEPICPTCGTAMDAEHAAREIAKIEAVIDSLEAEHSELSARASELQVRAKEYQDAIKEVTDLTNEMRVLEQVHENFRNDLTQLRAERDALATRVDGVAGDLTSLDKELRGLVAKRDSLDDEQRVERHVGVMLKDSGVKAAIVKQYVPVINKLINKYLAALDFFVNFELDEEFNERILSRHRDDFSYNSFSEGEKTRINLAILFAWRAIAKMRNSAATNVVIMDEVFDSSLDAAGAEDFTAMLGKLVGDTNFVIISHRTDQMTDRFDRVIKFNKVKNYSVVEK